MDDNRFTKAASHNREPGTVKELKDQSKPEHPSNAKTFVMALPRER
jgi:hypothetical protein